MTKTTKILKTKEKSESIPNAILARGDLVHQPSFGKGRAPIGRKTRQKLGWEKYHLLESVVGYDDRERVSATDEYPWCLIAFLEIEFAGGGKSIGTGWLVGNNKLLTAGHCLFSHTHGWATGIRVTPGNDVENPTLSSSDDAPYGSFEAVALQTTSEWIESPMNVAMDIGIIHIDHPIGDDLGYFGISIYDGSDALNGSTIRVAGYPRDYHPKDDVTGGRLTKRVAGQMYSHTDQIIDIRNGRIYYSLDTTGGQSGSPVMLLGADALGLIVMGIHNYGFRESELYHENKATLINEKFGRI